MFTARRGETAEQFPSIKQRLVHRKHEPLFLPKLFHYNISGLSLGTNLNTMAAPTNSIAIPAMP